MSLEETENRYRRFFNAANDGMFVMVLSPEGGVGRFVEVNEMACQMTGFSRQELLTMSPRDLVPADEPDLAPEIVEAMKTRHRAVFERTIRAKDGRLIPVELSLHLFAFHGRPTILGVVRDISERRQAECQLQAATDELVLRRNQLEEDLKSAAEIQKALLPKNLPQTASLEAAWRFLPWRLVGGDIFNLFHLGRHLFGAFIMDVSGQGAPAAMLAVSLAQMLSPGGPIVRQKKSLRRRITPPAEVLSALNRDYPFERFNKFVTMVYLTIRTSDGLVRFANAGHPPPVLIRAEGGFELLETRDTVIGVKTDYRFEEVSTRLRPGDRLILYTDGLLEHLWPDELARPEALAEIVGSSRQGRLAPALERAMDALKALNSHHSPHDDISLLGIEFKG